MLYNCYQMIQQPENKNFNALLRQPLVAERYKSSADLSLTLNRSAQNLISPFAEPARMKFPKHRHIRKQSSTSMLTQTNDQQTKATVRTFRNSNYSSIFEDPEEVNSRRRSIRSPGIFHSLSLESKAAPVFTRCIEDIGVQKNRKKPGLFKENSIDPILIGEAPTNKRVKLKVIHEHSDKYNQQRGQRMRNNLIWDKVKPKTYLERFRAARQIK